MRRVVRRTVRPEYRHKRSTVAGLLVYATFIVAAIAWFAFYQFPSYLFDQPQRPATDKIVAADHRAGKILIPLGIDRACRQVTFDNITGSFHETGVSTCEDETPGTNSTQGRMHAIKGAFSKK